MTNINKDDDFLVFDCDTLQIKAECETQAEAEKLASADDGVLSRASYTQLIEFSPANRAHLKLFCRCRWVRDQGEEKPWPAWMSKEEEKA